MISNSNHTMKIQEEGEPSKPKVIAQTSSLYLGPVPTDQEGSAFSGPVLRDQGSVGSLLSSNSNFSVAIGLREFLKPQSQNLNDHHRNSKSIETSSIGNSSNIAQSREKISQMENFNECASGSGMGKKQKSKQNQQFNDYLLNNTTDEPLMKKSKTDSDIFITPEQNKCSICFVRFSNKEGLLRHIEMVHGPNCK